MSSPVAILLLHLGLWGQSGPPPVEARVAFEIPQRDLVPEGIAHDPEDGAFFVSSVYRSKIVRVDADGSVSTFVDEGRDGFLGGIGLEVDPERRLLWAATAMGDQTRGFDPALDGRSGLFAFGLDDGSLVRRDLLGPDPEKHFFNDLVVAADGDVYVTDTLTASVFRLTESQAFERWVSSPLIAYPNGIDLSADQERLYVAHDGGIAVIERASGAIAALRAPNDLRLDGIDGLYCVGDSLLAVQNHKGLNRIARFDLDSPSSVKRAVILLEDDPRFRIPTTAAVVGEEAWLIANSQLDAYDENGALLPLEELANPIVLRFPVRGTAR